MDVPLLSSLSWLLVANESVASHQRFSVTPFKDG